MYTNVNLLGVTLPLNAQTAPVIAGAVWVIVLCVDHVLFNNLVYHKRI